MNKVLLEINDFKGGVTLNEKLGRRDQFFLGSCVDFYSKPGKITLRPGFDKLSLSSATDLNTDFQCGLFTTTGDMFFGADTGILYKQNSSGSITLARTSTESGSIRELAQYKGYLYYPQDTTLGSYDLASTYTDNFQTGLNNVTYHDIEISADKMYMGNGQYLSSYDGTTFSSNALDLPAGWEIRPLANFGIPYIAIGANYKSSSGVSTACKVFLWNRIDDSWNDEIEIPETEIKAMIFKAGYLWIWAGRTCNLYAVRYGTREAVPVRSFINETPTSGGFEVYPNALTFKNQRLYFGLSGVNTASDEQNPTGVYSFSPNVANLQMNIDFQGSAGNTFKFLATSNYASTSADVLYFHQTSSSTQNIYCENILVSGASFTYTNATSCYIDTLRFEAPSGKRLNITGFGVDTEPLPASTTVTLEFFSDDSSGTVFSNYQTTGGTGNYKSLPLTTHSLKMRLSLSGSANRPYIKRIYVVGNLKDDYR